EATSVRPGLDAPPAAGVDDAETGGVEPASFTGPGSKADAACDHGVAKRPLGVVVCRRQVRVRDEGDDGAPVVEDFTGQIANLLLDLMTVTLTVPFDAGRQPLEGVGVGSVVDLLDEAAEVAHQIATEAGARAVVALGEGQGLADEMRQTALATGMIAVGAIAIGDQPAQEGVADQRSEFFLASAADAVNDRSEERRVGKECRS